LNDCYTDIPKKKVLTETEAAFQNYNKMIGTQENYINNREKSLREKSFYVILLLSILIVIIFILQKKNLLNIYIK